jgi:hypothetical protein
MEMCKIHVLTQVTAPYSKLGLVKDKNVTLFPHQQEGREGNRDTKKKKKKKCA